MEVCFTYPTSDNQVWFVLCSVYNITSNKVDDVVALFSLPFQFFQKLHVERILSN